MQHIANVPRCNVWADPGLGKTSIVLSTFEMLQLAGIKVFPALVLAPIRVARRVWRDEAKKWDHLHGIRVVSATGNAEERRCVISARQADVYTMNYENIDWLVSRFTPETWPFRTVIADESTKLKNFRLRGGGKRAAALSKIVSRTARWANLTGTPAPNGLIDLWGQNWFVDGGARLGRTFTQFKSRYFKVNQYTERVEPQPWAMEQIHAALADVTISLRADFDMQEPIIHDIEVDLPPAARTMYERMETEMLVELAMAKVVTAQTVADVSMKCMQICSGALYTDGAGSKHEDIHEEKLEAIGDLLDELNGNPLMLVYHFKHSLARLRKRFPFVRTLEKEEDEDAWNRGEVKMLAIHAASAGHGLNLQYGGHHLAFMDLNWNLEQYLQVIERIGPARQAQAGLDRKVVIHRLIARDTIDEVIADRLESKANVQDSLRRRFG